MCEEASSIALTGAQRRRLRAHAGRQAADKTLRYVIVADVQRSADEVRQQLATSEIVRCKFSLAEKKVEAKAMAGELAALTGATVAEVIGHTALLYRPGKQQLIEP